MFSKVYPIQDSKTNSFQKGSEYFVDGPRIHEFLKELNEKHGLTIVMVLHDINQAIRYSDHIILMKSGNVVAEGAPREVITKEVIKDVYGVNSVFHEDEELGLYMLPVSI